MQRKSDPKKKKKRVFDKAFNPRERIGKARGDQMHGDPFNLLVGNKGYKSSFINTEGEEEKIAYTYVIQGTSESANNELELYNFRRRIYEKVKLLLNFTEVSAVDKWSQNNSPLVLISKSGKKKLYRADTTTFNYNKGLRVTLFSSDLAEEVLNHGGKTVVPYSEDFERVVESLEAITEESLFVTSDMLAKTNREKLTSTSRNQNSIMGSNAKGQANAAGLEDADAYQWCHKFAHMILGRLSQVAANLVGGGKYANADMGKGEKPIPKISKMYPQGFYIDIKTEKVMTEKDGELKPTQLGYKIDFVIRAEPDLYIEFEFYMQRITPPQKCLADAVSISIDEKLNLIAYQRSLVADKKENKENIPEAIDSYLKYNSFATPLPKFLFSPGINLSNNTMQNSNKTKSKQSNQNIENNSFTTPKKK